MNGRLATVFRLVFLCVLLLGLATVGFAQGRGHGGGVGGGRGVGGGSGIGGPPAGVGVERGLGRSSDASAGRADRGRGNASDRSNGRSDEGLNRARTASGNLKHADQELRDNPGIARTLHTSANNLRSQYQAALATNPNLKFGQFVAATRLAQNLGARHPNITRNAILAGLASGKSIGQTLQSLGLSQRDAKDAKNQAEREIKRGKK
jgi:hypothetical protein